MKQYSIFFLFFLVIGIELQAQNYLIVKQKDGTEQEHLIASLQKLTFSDNNLVINNINGISSTYAINKIRVLIFGTANNTNTAISDNDFRIYPNPATDYLFLQETSSDECYIYYMDGRIAMHAQPSTNSINISSLPAGFYILKTNDHLAKFLKK